MTAKPKFLFDSRNVKAVLSKQQIHGIKVISGPKVEDEGEKGFRVFGSYVYRGQPLPGDIDGTQVYEFGSNKKGGASQEEAVKETIIILKETVKKILNTKDSYLGDIKIGVDPEIERIIIYLIDVINDYAFNEGPITEFIDVTLVSEGFVDELKKIKKIAEQMREHLKKTKQNVYPREKEDKLFEITIPQLLIHDYTVDYPKDYVSYIWNIAYQKNIISKEDHEEIKNLIPGKLKGKKGLTEFFTYCEFIRQLLILRWNRQEVLEGVKMIGNREISLYEAVDGSRSSYCPFGTFANGDGTCSAILDEKQKYTPSINDHIIKIDMFIVVSDKILEYSNVFTLLRKDEKGELIPMSYGRRWEPSEKGSHKLIRSLSIDMVQYYYETTDKYKKPMKYAKRMFVIALMTLDEKTGEKLVKLFRSDTNLLNYINGQIDLVIAMLTDQENPPMDVLFNQLEEQKFKISTIMDFDIDQNAFYDVINNIVSNKLSKKDMIYALTKIKKHFSEIIGDNVKKYLKKEKLWPGPHFSKQYLAFVYG
jgi:hypothetical protein